MPSTNAETEAPPRVTPQTSPTVTPQRRLSPERICPDQISRTVRKLVPLLP